MPLEGVRVPLKKIRKIRSIGEVMTRGAQAIASYKEQSAGGQPLPDDEQFLSLFERDYFGTAPIIAESIWQRFFRHGRQAFFPSFRDHRITVEQFVATFGPTTSSEVIRRADQIVTGSIDLLGYKDLQIGLEVDWHLEPYSGVRSPMVHWRAFENMPRERTGDKKIVWELNRHQHFFTLGVAFLLTGDERYGRVFTEHLASWMDANPPGTGINWSSSLEVAYRAISWIWAFHLFRDSRHFTPEMFRRAVKFLYCHGRHIEQYLSTYYSPNTHLTGEALGLYYLGTQMPFFKAASRWQQRGEQILVLQCEKQIRDDGVYFEQSTCYQRYTLDIYSHYIVLKALSGETADDTATLVGRRLKKALEFTMWATRPDGTLPSIGDDDGGRLLPLSFDNTHVNRGELALGAAIFDRKDLKVFGGEQSEEVFWLLGPAGHSAYQALSKEEPSATSKEFRAGGYWVMRDGFAGTDSFLMVDCGDVGALSGGHGHADTLSIEAALCGAPLFVDPGTYTYHESEEARDRFRSTAAHNTLEVDSVSSSEPGSTFSWKTRANARTLKWISEPRFDLFVGEHDGYERLNDPVTHRRTIFFLRNDYWIIHDVANASGEHLYRLNYQYAAGRTVSRTDNYVEDASHRLFVFGDHGELSLMDGQISQTYGQLTSAARATYSAAGLGRTEFFTFILPKTRTYDQPMVKRLTVAGASGFEIGIGNYTDILWVNDTRGAIGYSGVRSAFRYTWLRTGSDGIEEFIGVDGDRLEIGNSPILNTHTEFACGRVYGSSVYLNAAGTRRVIPLV